MEVPGLGVELELQLQVYATATATPDLSCICDLHHSSQQQWILNPLSEARGQTRVLMDASRAGSLTAEPQQELLYLFLFFFLFFFFVFLSFVVVIVVAISWATPAAYGGSQSKDLIRAVAAGLHRSHSNTGSEPRLRPTPQLRAMPDS